MNTWTATTNQREYEVDFQRGTISVFTRVIDGSRVCRGRAVLKILIEEFEHHPETLMELGHAIYGLGKQLKNEGEKI